jgi:hypothetical protein
MGATGLGPDARWFETEASDTGGEIDGNKNHQLLERISE